MKPLSFSICTVALLVSACRKDPVVDISSGDQPESALPRWEQTDQAPIRHRDILHGFNHNGHGFFLRDFQLTETDSLGHALQTYYISMDVNDGIFLSPTHSADVLAFVDASGQWMRLWNLDNPFQDRTISIGEWADPGSRFISMGRFDGSNGLLMEDIIYPEGDTVKLHYFTFEATESTVNYEHDYRTWYTGSTYQNHAERITTIGDVHALILSDQPGTWFADHNGIDALPNASFRMWDAVEIRDTIYAGNYYSSEFGWGLFMSTDHGGSWSQVVSGIRFDDKRYHVIDDRLVLSQGADIYWMEIDWAGGYLYLHPLNNLGLLEDPWFDEVRNLFKMGGRVWAATTKGVTSIPASDFWTPMERASVQKYPLR